MRDALWVWIDCKYQGDGRFGILPEESSYRNVPDVHHDRKLPKRRFRDHCRHRGQPLAFCKLKPAQRPYNYFSEITSDQIVYLAVRVDPHKVLPAGSVAK